MAMVGQYLWGTIQAHRFMDEFLRSQLGQHTEVAPYITLYLFEHQALRVEMAALKRKVNLQSKIISQMKKTCKEIWSRMDLLTDKAKCLGNKDYEGLDVTVQVWRDESVRKENRKNDGYFSPENIGPSSAIEGGK